MNIAVFEAYSPTFAYFHAFKNGTKRKRKTEKNGMCVYKLKTAYRKILSQTEDPPWCTGHKFPIASYEPAHTHSVFFRFPFFSVLTAPKKSKKRWNSVNSVAFFTFFACFLRLVFPFFPFFSVFFRFFCSYLSLQTFFSKTWQPW